eukprot:SAG11_NODE_21011_length_434_cov_0.573134_1_plen_144_part_11
MPGSWSSQSQKQPTTTDGSNRRGGRRRSQHDGAAAPRVDECTTLFRSRDACFCYSNAASCASDSWGMCSWNGGESRCASVADIRRTNLTIMLESLTAESVFSQPRLKLMQKLQADVRGLAQFSELCERYTVHSKAWSWTGLGTT